jgi:hypothetical protein
MTKPLLVTMSRCGNLRQRDFHARFLSRRPYASLVPMFTLSDWRKLEEVNGSLKDIQKVLQHIVEALTANADTEFTSIGDHSVQP